MTKPQRPLTIGLLVRDFHLSSRMRFFDGAANFCMEVGGVRAFLLPVKDGCPPDAQALKELDGVVAWTGTSDFWLLDLWQTGIPMVNCNDAFLYELPTVSPGWPDELAFEHLCSLDISTIGYVTTSAEGAASSWFLKESAKRRLDGRIFSGVNVDPALHPGHLLCGDGETALEEFLSNLPKPAALWCVHDEMAALVWRKAEKLGIDVPADLMLMGSGDHPCAIHAASGITTVRVESAQLGYEAARLLYASLVGNVILTECTVLEAGMLSRVVERNSTGGVTKLQKVVDRAWRKLRMYPDDGLTVDGLIEEAGVARKSFYKEFEKTFGLSPGQAIRQSRLRKAMDCLRNPELRVSQVGRKCGFPGESEFSNFFKRETGKGPMEWRQEVAGARS